MEAPVDGGTDIHVGFDVNRPDVPIKYIKPNTSFFVIKIKAKSRECRDSRTTKH